MGKMNLLKANWYGKVGQTVGAKWKNVSTIRTYTKPSNPDTAAQQSVRKVFTSLTSFVAIFADAIKYKTALDVSGMSVRNAIIKLNKEQVSDGAADLENLLISKGGLQKPANFVPTLTSNKISATWAKPTATNFSENAKLVIVAVDPENINYDVIEVDATEETAAGAAEFASGADVYVFAYYLDSRGSNKVASVSIAKKLTNA